MPFNRPTLQVIEDRVKADIEGRFDDLDPKPRRSYVGIFSRTMAGAFHELYGYLEYVSDQIFDDSADEENLERRARQYGITRVAAVKATGDITLTGIAPTIIPAKTVWRSSAGQDYETTAEVILSFVSEDITVTAVLAGAAGNSPDATRLALINPVSGLESAATASGALSGGANIESVQSLQLRLQLRRSEPPLGGANSDYELWARSGHQDVTRVWTRPNTPDLGQVTVYIMTDDATDNGIPGATTVTTVQDYINGVRPVTADVTGAAPTAVEMDIEITGIDLDTTDVREAVTAEIADLIRRESEPGGTILVSHIREAISTAAGEIDHELTSPVADVAHNSDQIAVPGDITWLP